VSSTARIRILGALTLVAAWALLLALTASPALLLFAAPFFMLAGLLAAGEQPGVDLIERIVRLASDRHRPAGRSMPAFARIARPGMLRYDLISSNLAGRAPPLRRV
jgi:hypothetical protein